MIRKVSRHQFAVAVFILVGGMVAALGAPMDGAPPKELLQYVHDAKKRGVKEDKIKQQAIAVGWAASVVDDAIAFEKSGKSLPPATLDAGATRPVKAQLVAIEPAPATKPVTGVLKQGEVPQDYQITAGDTLQVSVWKEPEASVPNEIVRPDGKITVPLIKEVEVAGLTPKEVEKMVTERLAKFIADANVTVVVTAMGVKNVFVAGAVKKEGPVPFVTGMTVLQALSEAGGLTDYAKRKHIYILHTENGTEYHLDFNYDEVVRGEHMEQNIVLVPNDTIVIPH